MDKNLEGLENIGLAYKDDIIIFIKVSREEHQEKLKVIL